MCQHHPQGLGRALTGTPLSRPSHHGKWLIVLTGATEVLMHFGMTGLLVYTTRLARSNGERDEVTGPLGPDAWTWTSRSSPGCSTGAEEEPGCQRR